MTQTRSFWDVAATYPDRLAVHDSHGVRLSFGELAATANQLSRLIRDAGAEKGDAVLAICGNTTAYAQLYVACLQIGCYFVPSSPKAAVDDMRWMIEDSRPAVIIADANLDVVAAAVAQVPDPGPALFVLSAVDAATGASGDGFSDAAVLAASYSTEPLSDPVAGTRMLYTGGTTGKPKGIRFALPDGTPNESAERLCRLWADRLGMSDAIGPHLVSCPLYHGLALMTASVALHLGNPLVMLGRWAPEHWLASVQEHAVASTSVVPTMLSRLMATDPDLRESFDVSSLRSVVHSGAPCPVAIKRELLDWLGDVVWEFYGASEAVGTAISSVEWRQRPGSVGTPLPGADVVVVDADGEPASRHGEGEILIRGAGGRAEFTGAASVRPGHAAWPDYVSAGDIGHLDDEGYLFVTDRVSDVIISGGVNVYSARVEAVLVDHPGVVMVAVIGVRDPDWGERVVAIVQSDPGTDHARLSADLHDMATASLAPAQRPKEIGFVDAMPLTRVGKLDKRQLKTSFAMSDGT